MAHNTGLLKFFVRLLRELVPEDSRVQAGYGPFSLPEGHPFHRIEIGGVHDFYFMRAEECKKKGIPLDSASLDEADFHLGQAMVLIALNAPTLEERLQLLEDTCVFWPLARDVGKYIWEGPKDANI